MLQSVSLSYSSFASASASPVPSGQAHEDASAARVSLAAAPDARLPLPEISFIDQVGVVASTTRDNGGFSAAEVRKSDASTLGGTITANGTRLAGPPLALPSTLAGLTSSTNLAFPTFSLNTSNSTTTKGQHTNSSTAARPTITIIPPTTAEHLCTASPPGVLPTVIEYSIIHTWTITWLGDPTDYTPLFPTISTLRPCTSATNAAGRFTVSACDNLGQSCSLVHTTVDLVTTGSSTTTDRLWDWLPETTAVRGIERTLTFVTTDKNPAVVFPTSLPPDYGGSPDPMGDVHSAAYPKETQSSEPPAYGNEVPTTQSVRSAPATSLPPVTIIVKPGMVVVNDQTFSDNLTQPTSAVVVDGNTFTINPTQVIGVGATVTREPNSRTRISPPVIKTTIGDIGVDVEGSTVVIDKTSFTIGPQSTEVVIEGQTITLKLGAIVFPSQTLVIPASKDTTQVVVGAELITAMGSDKAIIEGKTITYGPGSSTVTEAIDEDTMLIGPSGIIAHGETYGGSNAASTGIQVAVVGGVTISQIGPTALVIWSVTYTLDSLASRHTKLTTVLGKETLTIGPEGVAIDSWTLHIPSASTTTIIPRNGAAVAPPTVTVVSTKKKNDGPSLASRRPRWLLTACIATSAGILGGRLL